MTDHAVATHEKPHPGTAVYIKIALTLFVLTALEVGSYEIARRGAPPGLAAFVGPFIIEILLTLSAAKFALVAMFYMHLKQDSKIFSSVFVFPIIIAAILLFALVALFWYLRLQHP